MTEIHVEKLLTYMQKRFDEMEEFIKLGLVQNVFRELNDELKSIPTVGHKELYLQLSGKEWRVSDWQAQAINAFVSAGNEVIDVKEIAVSCFDRHMRESGVHSYCYKPEPIFYGDGPRYFGVELEIDEGGESHGNARRLQAIANKFTENIYIKHDGSLDDGMEIVTHPMSLNYHREGMPWREVLDKARCLGYTSHQAGTCGLHIHVNRDSLGEARQEQEDTIARILFLVETFWNERLRFSRRTQSQMDHWASRYGRKDDPKDVLHSAKNRADRYTCVNLLPYNTIEFRMFRGTLKYNTLIATLQLVEILCDVASALSDDEIKNLTWTEFVSNLDEDTVPELIQYLKERRLYVNEPVNTTEEV